VVEAVVGIVDVLVQGLDGNIFGAEGDVVGWRRQLSVAISGYVRMIS